jgi:hypothetical protein
MAEENGSERAVAILIAVAAIVGVALGARATLLSSDASDTWKSAVRTEVKRAAASVEDVRYVYVTEAPLAMQVVTATVRARALEQSAQATQGIVRSALLAEAETQRTLAAQIAKSAPDVKKYGTRSGGFDAAKRLADQRKRFPDLVALDPDERQRAGDRISRHSMLDVLATVPAGIAFLLGAFAEAFHRRRRLLVFGGALFVAAAVVFGIVVEIV